MSESKLSSFLLHTAEQVIKVIPVPELQAILVQGVAQGKAESTLYAFQLPVPKALWEVSLQEHIPGWPSLQSVIDGKACFSCFPDPSLPATEGLYVFDLRNQQWIVKEKDYSFIKVEGKNLLIRKAGDEENFYLLDLSTLAISLSPRLRSIQLTKPATEGILYPYHIGEENPLYPELSAFVKEKAAHSLVGMVEYLEWKNERIVLSYYIEGEKELDQYLLITDKESKVLWLERIDEQLKGMALDVFMIVQQQCIYVKDKNQLRIYDLS
ncbi:MAG: hypothetical protein JWM14_3399 [Chitinophagaceae bacterium]|nr:hypothetical protein [Chitinophagaceae bacterium]